MHQMNQKHGKEGQAILIILLVIVVGLSLGLLLASRITSDITTTTKITDSSRAFNAAEAGIEEGLRTASIIEGSPIPVSRGDRATYLIEKTAIAPIALVGNEGVTNYFYPEEKQPAIEQGEVLTVWLSEHDTNGKPNFANPLKWWKLNVCFDVPDTSVMGNVPAVAATIFFRHLATGIIKAATVGYDMNQTRTPQSGLITQGPGTNRTGNGNCTEDFVVPQPNSGGIRSDNRIEIMFDDDGNVPPQKGPDFGYEIGEDVYSTYKLVALRLRPLYNPSSMAAYGASGVTHFSSMEQGETIDSLGQFDSIARRIRVDSPYDEPPPFMDYAVYSFGDGDIVK